MKRSTKKKGGDLANYLERLATPYAKKLANDPALQARVLGAAKSAASKGFQYAQEHPNTMKKLASQAMQASQDPRFQEVMFGQAVSSSGSLEQRVGKLEQQMRMLLSMSSQYEGGKRKTRKQKRRGKARKTRKH